MSLILSLYLACIAHKGDTDAYADSAADSADNDTGYADSGECLALDAYAIEFAYPRQGIVMATGCIDGLAVTSNHTDVLCSLSAAVNGGILVNYVGTGATAFDATCYVTSYQGSAQIEVSYRP